MRLAIIIWIFTVLPGCNLAEKENTQPTTKDSLDLQIDTAAARSAHSEYNSETDPNDSFFESFDDTTTLKGKQLWIMNSFKAESKIIQADYDTLMDLTYDGFKDYIIGYYGQSGTGIKNRVNVYIYNPKNNSYILNEQLSNLPNPTFYISQKIITGFYIGNGGGGGGRLEWINGKWLKTKEFDVDNEGDTSKWKISFPLKKKTEIVTRPFQMIPPEDI